MSAMRYALDVSNAIRIRCQQCDMRLMSAMRYAFDVFMRRDMSVLNVRKTLSIKDPPTLYCPFSSSRNVLYLN